MSFAQGNMRNAKDMFRGKRSPTFMFFQGFKENVLFFSFGKLPKISFYSYLQGKTKIIMGVWYGN